MSLNNYLIPQTLYCKYCSKECKNLNSLKQHECRCKENPNRIVNPNYMPGVLEKKKLNRIINKTKNRLLKFSYARPLNLQNEVYNLYIFSISDLYKNFNPFVKDC